MTEAREFKSFTIAGPSDGPRLLVIAGVHGDEFEPMAAVRELGRRLPGMLRAGTVTLVPVANPNALARIARCAEDGLDLARTCPGRADGSVTERVAAELSELISNATHLIDLHTGGVALKIVPMCGYMLVADNTVLDVQRGMAKAFGLPDVWGTSASLEGRTLSVARDAGVPAVYVEVGGGSTFNQSAVEQMVDGCLNACRFLNIIGGPLLPSRFRLTEDNRRGSGHLQVQNPSPLDGLFESAVKLGANVAAGDVIGTVRSLINDEQAVVRTQTAGVVFVLREIAAVRRGDALAVVVETGS